MPRHNPVFDRDRVLTTLKARRGMPFTPIQAFDMPLDEYRVPRVTQVAVEHTVKS